MSIRIEITISTGMNLADSLIIYMCIHHVCISNIRFYILYVEGVLASNGGGESVRQAIRSAV